jgi:hypothetical protein
MTKADPVSGPRAACVSVECMQGLAVIVFPILLMLFALAMEKLQTSLDRLTVDSGQVDEFLERADSTDVKNLAETGLPAALDELRNRRRADGES